MLRLVVAKMLPSVVAKMLSLMVAKIDILVHVRRLTCDKLCAAPDVIWFVSSAPGDARPSTARAVRYGLYHYMVIFSQFAHTFECLTL